MDFARLWVADKLAYPLKHTGRKLLIRSAIAPATCRGLGFKP